MILTNRDQEWLRACDGDDKKLTRRGGVLEIGIPDKGGCQYEK
jgi:hypothetical protein